MISLDKRAMTLGIWSAIIGPHIIPEPIKTQIKKAYFRSSAFNAVCIVYVPYGPIMYMHVHICLCTILHVAHESGYKVIMDGTMT